MVFCMILLFLIFVGLSALLLIKGASGKSRGQLIGGLISAIIGLASLAILIAVLVSE